MLEGEGRCHQRQRCLSHTGCGGSTVANGLNQYTAAAGGTVTHDTNGNIAGDGTWTFTYDQNNRLKTANKTGASLTLAYDAEGRLRQHGAGTNKLYDGHELVAEYTTTMAAAVRRCWVHGPGIGEPITYYQYPSSTSTIKAWLIADHQGSVVAELNTAGAHLLSGTYTATYSYGPFGELNLNEGRFRYTGQQRLDGTEFHYDKARIYYPKLGRFLQTDPIGTADDLNLYAYVGNNPVNYRDPSGMVLETAWDVLNIGLGAASFASDVRSGRYWWAAADAAGLVYDTAAVAVPFLPAGAGTGIKTIRAGME
jgi:RHS repeat-associated protein